MADKKVKNTAQEKPKADAVEVNALAEEYKNKYLRALADYQNLEKRVREERSDLILSANRILILKLLPFLDTLTQAEVFVKDPGLKLAISQLDAILKEFDVKELDVLNKEYDPYTAEVIDITPGKEDNMVTEVLRKGYSMGDKILRVAQVKVSKKTS